ncbi:YciI family protein [Amycolatopsis sp. FDAARGOS 1241]|uniref:YciI family protein n=1 Tax=Amycolatopsis sp. FDAARGOS 1241 TaxID=2778070 RepID=UPI00194F17D6|nr:YciI family protein [Amycolatopsis sp. FDAARGOS 1241]QRP44894.1 transcription initiation protein [Amycolatopsis sp. FDAARGOS 1241]
MRYLMLICGTSHDESKPAGEPIDSATEAWVKEMDGRGVRLMGQRLRPASSATTVRVQDGEVLLTDGPFAETKEQILGFDLLECADLDEALEVAAKHPAAQWGPVEVRPLWPFGGEEN